MTTATISSSTSTAPQPRNAATHAHAEPWDQAAAAYSNAVGASSRIAGQRLTALADSLQPLSGAGARALELGAGTGSLTHALLAHAPGLALLATDISPTMLDHLVAATPGDGAGVGVAPPPTRVLDMTSPITPDTPRGAYTHVLCSMAIQNLDDPASALALWMELLAPGGVLAVAVWDFDEPCGPQEVWGRAARAVRPAYVNPPVLPPGRWTGLADLERGMRDVGLFDVRAEPCDVGFSIGTESFMDFFWESDNPMPMGRIESFGPDGLSEVRAAMRQILENDYQDGTAIPLWTGLAVGRKQKEV